MEPWAWGWGGGWGSTLQLTNMDSIFISGSLGRLCKSVRQSGETGGGRCSAVCALRSHSLLYPERVQERKRVMEVGARGGWMRRSGRKGRGLYTLTQQQRLRLGGSGVCIVLCAKATNRSHVYSSRLVTSSWDQQGDRSGRCCGWQTCAAGLVFSSRSGLWFTSTKVWGAGFKLTQRGRGVKCFPNFA